jgi:hypothetical protein
MSSLTSLPSFATGISIVMTFVALILWQNWSPACKPVLRTALAILSNWLTGVLYVQLTGDYVPWHFNIVIDGLAAFIVMYHPAGKPQGYIGLFYITQIACHIAFGIRNLGIIGEPGESTVYYDTITWIAWAQLIAIGVWCGGIWHNAHFCRIRHWNHVQTRNARSSDYRETW